MAVLCHSIVFLCELAAVSVLSECERFGVKMNVLQQLYNLVVSSYLRIKTFEFYAKLTMKLPICCQCASSSIVAASLAHTVALESL